MVQEQFANNGGASLVFLCQGTFALVEIYNPVTKTWRDGLDMPVGLHGLRPVVWNNTMYILGSGPAIDRGTSKVAMMFGPV